MRRALIVALVLLAGCGGSDSEEDSDPALNAPALETTSTREEAAVETTPAQERPPITQRRIPFGERRRQETAEYAQRHYGAATSTLDPKVIVQHVTVTPTFEQVYDTFSVDRPDPELNELPNVCSHFVIDRDGTIYQLVSLELICRHTVGLNDRAIGIEHVGATDAEVLGNAAQMRASVELTGWLRCRYGVSIADVIGHNESLSSPYHHERVASLRSQTHDDWKEPSMDTYRSRLRDQRC